MADDVVILPQQFLAGKTADFDKSIIRVGDDAFEIGPGNDVLSCGEFPLNARNWGVDLHDRLSVVGLRYFWQLQLVI